MSPKFSTVGIVYSDASDSGFGGYLVKCGREKRFWFVDCGANVREFHFVKFVRPSLVPKLTGSSVKWFTDNQNGPRILTCGSRKTHLQSEALDIYNICVNNGISIEMEWITRNQNEQADYLSGLYDPDLFLVSLRTIDEVWASHTVDRFANILNSKLPRFNSRYWNPGSEDIDCFVNWQGENNYVCPPISLIPRVVLHMKNCRAVGTLIVPLWLSAPFWPMLIADGINFKDFVISFMDIPSSKEFFTPGFCNSIFGNQDLSFRVLALRVQF